MTLTAGGMSKWALCGPRVRRCPASGEAVKAACDHQQGSLSRPAGYSYDGRGPDIHLSPPRVERCFGPPNLPNHIVEIWTRRCRRSARPGIHRTKGSLPTLPTPTSATLTHARSSSSVPGGLTLLRARCWPTPLRHAANSGAILQLPESHSRSRAPGHSVLRSSRRRAPARAGPCAGAALGWTRGVFSEWPAIR